jgi:hypothetical protein
MIMRLLILSVCLLGFSSPVWAQARGYLGAQGGISVPDYDDTSSRFAFGFSGGARLDGEFGIGAYYLSSAKEETMDGVDRDFNFQLYGFEGSYHFEGVADGAYLGVRAGISKVKASDVDFSPTNYGALFGYDYFVNPMWSIGLEGSYFHVEGDTKDNATLDSFNSLQLLASTKVWF